MSAGGNWTRFDLDEHYRKLTARPGAEHEPAPDVLEAEIEAECTKILQGDGWRPLRTDPVSDRGRGKGFGEPGMADHLYLRYWGGEYPAAGRAAGEHLWIEFKRRDGKPSKRQLEWHAIERARGAMTLIAGEDFAPSVAGFKAWYEDSGLCRNRRCLL